MKRPPTEAALLLLGVKRDLLGLHLLHQFFNPINRKLVGDRSAYAFVVLDLAVEFDTLVAHFYSAFARSGPSTLTAAYKTAELPICSSWRIRTLLNS